MAAGAFVQWRDYLPAFALLMLGLSALVFARLAPSGDDGRYAIVVPPWQSLASAINQVQQANGQVLSIQANRSIVIAVSERRTFVDDLYAAGAVLVINPFRSSGCSSYNPVQKV